MTTFRVGSSAQKFTLTFNTDTHTVNYSACTYIYTHHHSLSLITPPKILTKIYSKVKKTKN